MGVNYYDLRKALAANSAATSFAGKTPVAVKPDGAGIFDLTEAAQGVGHDHYLPTFLKLIPFGTDANDETFSMRLWGWTKVHNEDLWIPELLLELAVTLGNIAASEVGTSHFLADTIAITDGAADNGFNSLITPENDTPASVLAFLRGCPIVEFTFDLTGAAAANCFWTALNEVD